MMNIKKRQVKDGIFTFSAYCSVILLVLALIVVLVPMLMKGATAVGFDGTVEFRRLQLEKYSRGNRDLILDEMAASQKGIEEIYAMIDKFNVGIDTSSIISEIKVLYREYGDELRFNDVPDDEYAARRTKAKTLRNAFIDALEAEHAEDISDSLEIVFKYSKDPVFKGTCYEKIFALASDFKEASADIDFAKRDEYKKDIIEIQSLLAMLFGPRPGSDKPALVMEQYGATRWDVATRLLDDIMYRIVWTSQDGSKKLVKTLIPRRLTFQGTHFEAFFDILPDKTKQILSPRKTIYWRYFIDDSTPGHFFGGVGPEILGTLILTSLAMLIAVPLGITAAAYLVECAGDNWIVKVIRGFINTLAGVPSIVFGLFGMAFFVTVLLPMFGQKPQPCILSAAMTLAILVLPVIIRSSEEAIKAVPRTYKEASLALGAGEARTFIFVTLPAAMPGILTGIILSLSRAAGETAPILFTGAVALGPLPKSIFSQTRTLSYGCYDIAVGDRLAMMVPHKQYGMVATLIVLVLLLNIIAICIRSRMSSKLKGQ